MVRGKHRKYPRPRCKLRVNEAIDIVDEETPHDEDEYDMVWCDWWDY
jgi:hypothetical protein